MQVRARLEGLEPPTGCLEGRFRQQRYLRLLHQLDNGHDTGQLTSSSHGIHAVPGRLAGRMQG